METPVARMLPDGRRLYLRHGPIELVIGAEGARAAAFEAARARFPTILGELVAELGLLRRPAGPGRFRCRGPVAGRMERAVRPFRTRFITPMAAVAGAVADEVLAAMRAAAPLDRAYVNNGGDIALWLAGGARFDVAMADIGNAQLGRIAVGAGRGVGGIATSGWSGRSHSLGIADSVTVLAADAAAADAAATLVANAVDLPGHPGVARRAATSLDPSSDLGERLVTVGVGPLAPCEARAALAAGRALAEDFAAAGRIVSAALFLSGEVALAGDCRHFPAARTGRLEIA